MALRVILVQGGVCLISGAEKSKRPSRAPKNLKKGESDKKLALRRKALKVVWGLSGVSTKGASDKVRNS